ncbi:vomeronasal type-2 receptor 26-like [Hyperolius riggenbachi]|uniref:vomeronasal type-2 receptor 26-like n=1 Tax=Hyperolius riggenbachi TaxID=752182 RepID=UPI0035A3059D
MCESEAQGLLYIFSQLITYGYKSPGFSDKIKFPSLHHTFPSSDSQSRAVVQLLKHFGWTWVGIVSSEDESSQGSSLELQEALSQNGICVEFKYIIKNIESDYGISGTLKLWQRLIGSSCNVIIINGNLNLNRLIERMKFEEKIRNIFIFAFNFPYEFSAKSSYVLPVMLNGSLFINLHKVDIPGLKDFLLTANPEKYPKLRMLRSIWKSRFTHADITNKVLNLSTLEQIYLDTENFRVTFQVYAAVYSLAHALHEMYPHKVKDGPRAKSSLIWQPWKTPTLVCSESCRQGYHKVPMEVIHRCCYTCAPCIEGEVTNNTGGCCWKCPDDSWSSVGKDKCVPRPIEFLSFEDVLGVFLLTVTFLFCFFNSIVVGVFIKHKNTAVVKANNQSLSFILLLSLILSFLCVLLFIGQPTEMSCLLRHAAFGIIFTISVSSVLAKTVTVIVAFRGTKPGWTFKRWLKRYFSISLLIVCSSGQVVICVFWLVLSPPFPEQDTQAELGKIILQCNEGSVTLFYTVIGYMGCLAVLSFIVAFSVRKLPDTFNEAQYITFSMLVFCSVWISFIPAYLSTKGKYMVAVEVFSILASSAGLLGCIFIPKCYIILLRPELNTRSCLTTKKKLQKTAM